MMAAANLTIVPLLGKISEYILNPLIVLAFAVALLIFFWGIFQFISSEAAGTKRAEGQKKIIYGLLGMFIMFSAYGIIGLILDTFNLPAPSNLPL
jgi:hypothetical protein